MALRGNAAFVYTASSGQEVVHALNSPIREIRPRFRQRRFANESWDYSAREVVTIGNGVHELVGRLRFEDIPQALIDLIAFGANDGSLTYYPDLENRADSYACDLIWDDDVIELAPDPDRFWKGEYDVTVVLRKSTAFTGLLTPLLFRYRGGESLARATFARADAATCATRIDKDGVIRTVAANVPRTEWLDLDADGVRETPALLLELSRANLVTRSHDLSTTWTDTGTPTTTGSQADAFGGTTGTLLGDDNSGAVEGKNIAVTFTGDGTKAASWILKKGTATLTDVLVYDNTAAAARHAVRVTWGATENDTPTLSTLSGSGTLFPVRRLTGGWWWIGFSAASVTAANSNLLRIFPATSDTSASTGDVYFCHAQAEDGEFPTSPIVTTGSSVTRARDNLSWEVSALGALRDISVYCRLRKLFTGDGDGGSTRIWQIGALAGGDPRLVLFYPNDSVIRLTHDPGASLQNTDAALTTDAGDVVETVATFGLSGAGRILACKNSGTPTGSNLTALTPGTWSDDVLSVNGISAANDGAMHLLEVKLIGERLTGTDAAILARAQDIT